MTTVSTLVSELYDNGVITRVIQPAALLTEEPGRSVIVTLSSSDVRHRGFWDVATGAWTRYDRPWLSATARGESIPVGSIHVLYGVPSRYDITLYRVTISSHGAQLGWTVGTLCDEALRPAHLTLDTCPRAALPRAEYP